MRLTKLPPAHELFTPRHFYFILIITYYGEVMIFLHGKYFGVINEMNKIFLCVDNCIIIIFLLGFRDPLHKLLIVFVRVICNKKITRKHET